ncbi:acyl-CoA dehydrogenase family protein [Streptomyces canus]|uniref:acyl-CoA dehydrogenase family protein n=1 Tax=Streptomyces canus TaxID=58343 RepID=UPI002E26E0B0
MEQLLQELRSFLDAEVPRFREKWGDDAGSWEARCAWQRTTAGGKWPAPAWSEEHGGRGACVATLASDDVHGARTTVSDDAAGGRLSGAKTHVLDAHIADVLLVTAVRGERVQVFAVDPRAEGVELRPLTVLDRTRKQYRVELTDVKGQLLDEDFGAGLSLTLYVAAVLACAELLGVAGRCLETAVEYALDREQFGRPIDGFQAVKHLLADSLVAVEQMRAAVGGAAEIAEGVVSARGRDGADLAEVASVVKAHCSKAAPGTAETLVQVLGGIGFTWEHPAHLYLRRAKTLEVLYGNATEHRAWLARALELVPA